VTGFGNVTCLALLTHLHNNYGNITEQELEINVL
jgi:Cys-tRNA synthase (O-phospho-L-seryl-tRNA:Cys-tRNA synthase)